jgi:uncharacterized protein YbjQ (UPF0145 family)
VTTLDNQLAEGVIDPADIVSPRTAVNEFANSDEQTRAAAHLAFSGAYVPDGELGFKAKVSHPDLASDSLWGTLFVSFSVSSPPDIKPNTTISSTDYRIAYLSYFRKDNGEHDVRLLSGSSNLEVLDVADLSEDSQTEVIGGEDAKHSEKQTAGTNGRVVVWRGDWEGDVPPPIEYPADHSNWQVVIDGDVNKHTAPVGDVQTTETDGTTEHYIEPTGLAEGETVHGVRIVESVSMTQPTSYVQDTSNVNQEDIEKRLQAMKELQQQIEDLENSTIAGGGSLFGGGLPSLPGLTFVQSAIVTGGGILGLSFLTR